MQGAKGFPDLGLYVLNVASPAISLDMWKMIGLIGGVMHTGMSADFSF